MTNLSEIIKISSEDVSNFVWLASFYETILYEKFLVVNSFVVKFKQRMNVPYHNYFSFTNKALQQNTGKIGESYLGKVIILDIASKKLLPKKVNEKTALKIFVRYSKKLVLIWNLLQFMLTSTKWFSSLRIEILQGCWKFHEIIQCTQCFLCCVF